jgi:hypothetical protein
MVVAQQEADATALLLRSLPLTAMYDDDGNVIEEEFFKVVTRDELRTLVDRVAKMHQEWEKLRADLVSLNKSRLTGNARQVDLEGRVALLERERDPSEHSYHHSSPPIDHDITENRRNVRVPIPRAAELLDKERVADEMIARYQWWTKKARVLGVTARQATWAFTKMVAKYAATAAITWTAYHFWTRR